MLRSSADGTQRRDGRNNMAVWVLCAVLSGGEARARACAVIYTQL